MNNKEKVALSSILASIILTATKLIIGVLTNSLGIISEALHSGLDLIAASTTYFAVRKADKPPDLEHHYGHGKVENLASLSETILLIVTGIWIVYEAAIRLIHRETAVEVGIVAVLVMVLSIAIDFSRSRALNQTAKKYNSQALEADAAHFSTDLISSIIVLMGVILTLFGYQYVDSLAAIGVAAVIFAISYRIGRKSIDSLMDKAPANLLQTITEEALTVKGVQEVARARVRESGPYRFIDLTVFISKEQSFESAHEIAEEVSERIRKIVANSDVTVHTEPI